MVSIPDFCNDLGWLSSRVGSWALQCSIPTEISGSQLRTISPFGSNCHWILVVSSSGKRIKASRKWNSTAEKTGRIHGADWTRESVDTSTSASWATNVGSKEKQASCRKRTGTWVRELFWKVFNMLPCLFWIGVALAFSYHLKIGCYVIWSCVSVIGRMRFQVNFDSTQVDFRFTF